MGFKLDRVHVWSSEVMDQAGGVAAKLVLLTPVPKDWLAVWLAVPKLKVLARPGAAAVAEVWTPGPTAVPPR